ncbi:MAG: hypothetical protein D6741_16160, partial [Planctomycetota bacterium]
MPRSTDNHDSTPSTGEIRLDLRTVRRHRRTPQEEINALLARIREAADKLAADGAGRGDLKLINRTLRELR